MSLCEGLVQKDNVNQRDATKAVSAASFRSVINPNPLFFLQAQDRIELEVASDPPGPYSEA